MTTTKLEKECWTWSQSQGELRNPAGEPVCKGYAGAGIGLNNPDMQHVKSIGPVVRGRYRIGPPEDVKGGFTLRLNPYAENDMLGRGHFLIHGMMRSESSVPIHELTDHDGHRDGEASQGCICIARRFRELIWQSQCHVLEVVA